MAKVLIIDDDEQICDMLFQRIMRFGHAVDMAFNLTEGEKKYPLDRLTLYFLM